MPDEHTTAPANAAPEDSQRNYWHWPRLAVVWGAALSASIAVSLSAGESMLLAWMLAIVATATLATFALQLGTGQREGFIDRTAASVSGALVIVLSVALIRLFVF